MRTWQQLAGAGAILAIAAPGCVTRGTHDELAAERDRLRIERDSLSEYNVALERRMEELQLARESIAAELATTAERASDMLDTYDGLLLELQSEVESGQIQIQQVRDGLRVQLSQEILFGSGSAQLDEKGRNVIARVATQISDEDAVISVEGHSDDVPISSRLRNRFPSNWELAGARAASVVRLLSQEGVDPARLRAVSLGPFSPVASNDSPAGRAMNRRIEILLRPMPQ